MQNPKPLPPMVYVDIEVSYRWQGPDPACAFVSVVEQRNGTHRRIVDTRHLVAPPEKLIDQANALVQEWTREYVLAHVEPF